MDNGGWDGYNPRHKRNNASDSHNASRGADPDRSRDPANAVDRTELPKMKYPPFRDNPYGKDNPYDTDELYDSSDAYDDDDDFEDKYRRAGSRAKKTPQNLALFYTILLAVAVILCMVIFATIYNSFASKKIDTTTSNSSASDAALPNASFVAAADRQNATGAIVSIDVANGLVDALNVSSGASYKLEITSTSVLKDKSGASLLITEFNLGEIIEVEYNKLNNQIIEMSKSATAWIVRDRSKVEFETMTNIIRVDNDVYNYNDNLITFYEGKNFSPSIIEPIDVLTISGVATQAWSVILEKGHGTIMLSETDGIVNGVIEVDNDVYTSLSSNEPIYLTEGSHKIVARGDNIDPFTKEITVKPNETEYISLGDAEIKMCLLNVVPNVTDYRLIIDNEQRTPGEPIELPYGSHLVRVEKDGYTPAERTVELKEFTQTVDMNLNPVLRLGKIVVNSRPEGCKVFVDSAYVGDTPISISSELGLHTLMLSKDGYNSFSMTISVDRTDPPYNQYNLELTPTQPTYNPGDWGYWPGWGGSATESVEPEPSQSEPWYSTEQFR
ncbi:MAG: PEGA domain-containing protein [Clostridiales bacterium]|jgi:hypothetical protein|nr:PEGA domain-containing protein [Clostridiales bacterium]